jgi:hypothetical protein
VWRQAECRPDDYEEQRWILLVRVLSFQECKQSPELNRVELIERKPVLDLPRTQSTVIEEVPPLPLGVERFQWNPTFDERGTASCHPLLPFSRGVGVFPKAHARTSLPLGLYVLADVPIALEQVESCHPAGGWTVLLYIQGFLIGRLGEVIDQLPQLIRKGEPLEFRTDGKEFIGYYQPAEMPICPWHPEWTQEDIDRMSAEPGGMKVSEFWEKFGASDR